MADPINPEDFLSTNSTLRGRQRERTATWNYVATVRKATAVTHSCVGSFTGPNVLNLIICKGSHVEIYLMVKNELQHILDFPVVGKVVFLELSRQHPATVDYLYIATELFKFCVLRWDAKSSKMIAIYTTQYRPVKLVTGKLICCQGGTVCPRSGMVVLYSSQDLMRGITNVNFDEFESFLWRCLGRTVLDAKFLYGHGRPTIAVLYKRNEGGFRVRVYEVINKTFNLQAWDIPNVVEPTLLISVHQEPYGFLIIGKEVFVYVKEQGVKTKRMGFFNIKAYGRFLTDTKNHSYLLGDYSGRLLMIELPELTHRMLGRTSIPSSVSYLCNNIVFVGSCSTDSQLIKINHPSTLQVLSTYANLGPISDFCVINKSTGQRKVLMCCGTNEESALEVLYTGMGINLKNFIAFPSIANVWPLKSSNLHDNHTYLILQTHENVIFVYKVVNDNFVAHDLNGFTSGSTTLCCHNADYRQFIQVTVESVRLISSETGLLKNTWTGKSYISCASATPTQVLLATTKDLICLEIGDGQLLEIKQIQLKYDVACLDISIVGKSRYASQLAAVATWGENRVRILSLPELTLLAEEQLSCLPRCVLLCAFGVESYLLCGLGDGTLCTFRWKEEKEGNFQLQDKNSVSLGPSSRTLRKFSSEGEDYVFFSTTATPSVIFYKNEMLQHRTLNLTNIVDACPFHCDYMKDSVVVIRNDGFISCTLGEIAESGKIMMASCGRRICHQEETQSYAIIAEDRQQMKRHHILLLDKSLNTSSSFNLEEHEVGLSIVSSRFDGENLPYYCVGTSFNVPGEDNPTEGRILVLLVINGKLVCISDYQTNGAVHYLKGLHGGLLVNVSHTPHFFEWIINGGNRELQENPNLVEVEGLEERFSGLYSLSQEVEYELQDIVIAPENQSYHTAIQMMENGVLFSSDAQYVIRSHNGVNMVVGQWYSGEFITQIKVGSLSRLSDEDYAQVPSVLFSTTTGAVGVIVSLPYEVFTYLDNLEKKMRKARNKKKAFVQPKAHDCIGLEDAHAKHFIDGDLLESYMTLSEKDQKEIADNMEIDARTLKKILKYLVLFH